MTHLSQVPIKSKIRRIIMIAFTNHAFDHLIGDIPDASIMDKVARLSSQPVDERIAAYSLGATERTSGVPRNGDHERGRPLKEPLDIYDTVAAVAVTRSAHMTAYEAAICMHYDQEP